jgi:hypothetical protein
MKFNHEADSIFEAIGQTEEDVFNAVADLVPQISLLGLEKFEELKGKISQEEKLSIVAFAIRSVPPYIILPIILKKDKMSEVIEKVYNEIEDNTLQDLCAGIVIDFLSKEKQTDAQE